MRRRGSRRPRPTRPLHRRPARRGAGITLPPGFCATIFADNLGNARHLAVAPNGTVYVNTLGGPSSASGFLVALRDTKGQGRADVVQRFGAGAPGGGTGIAFTGAIFAG
jgi:hypothetical protein